MVALVIRIKLDFRLNHVKFIIKKLLEKTMPLPIDTCGLAEWDFDPESWYAP